MSKRMAKASLVISFLMAGNVLAQDNDSTNVDLSIVDRPGLPFALDEPHVISFRNNLTNPGMGHQDYPGPAREQFLFAPDILQTNGGPRTLVLCIAENTHPKLVAQLEVDPETEGPDFTIRLEEEFKVRDGNDEVDVLCAETPFVSQFQYAVLHANDSGTDYSQNQYSFHYAIIRR